MWPHCRSESFLKQFGLHIVRFASRNFKTFFVIWRLNKTWQHIFLTNTGINEVRVKILFRVSSKVRVMVFPAKKEPKINNLKKTKVYPAFSFPSWRWWWPRRWWPTRRRWLSGPPWWAGASSGCCSWGRLWSQLAASLPAANKMNHN